MIRTIVGADPGMTTGLCRIDLDAWRPPEWAQVSPGLVVPTVEVLIGAQDPAEVLLAVEQYVVGARAAKTSTPAAGRTTRELIGALLALAPYTRLRSAGEVKPWATDARLKAAGLYAPDQRHARDGGRHALFAAVQDCGMPDPLSKRSTPAPRQVRDR